MTTNKTQILFLSTKHVWIIPKKIVFSLHSAPQKIIGYFFSRDKEPKSTSCFILSFWVQIGRSRKIWEKQNWLWIDAEIFFHLQFNFIYIVCLLLTVLVCVVRCVFNWLTEWQNSWMVIILSDMYVLWAVFSFYRMIGRETEKELERNEWMSEWASKQARESDRERKKQIIAHHLYNNSSSSGTSSSSVIWWREKNINTHR